MTGHTELLVINNENLTAVRYILEILEHHILLFVPHVPYLGQGFWLMHYNGKPHVARAVRNYQEAVGIDTMAWPARSLGMNLIENLY